MRDHFLEEKERVRKILFSEGNKVDWTATSSHFLVVRGGFFLREHARWVFLLFLYRCRLLNFLPPTTSLACSYVFGVSPPSPPSALARGSPFFLVDRPPCSLPLLCSFVLFFSWVEAKEGLNDDARMQPEARSKSSPDSSRRESLKCMPFRLLPPSFFAGQVPPHRFLQLHTLGFRLRFLLGGFSSPSFVFFPPPCDNKKVLWHVCVCVCDVGESPLHVCVCVCVSTKSESPFFRTSRA